MLKEIKVVDKKRKIIRVTTVDERWYIKVLKRIKKIVPSTTWICSYYPMGKEFIQWVAKHGYKEAEAIKEAAGEKGSKVHQAIAILLGGGKIKLNQKLINWKVSTKNNIVEEEITAEEFSCVMSFVKWFKIFGPKVLRYEFVFFADDYAGTIDLECIINNELWIIDYKTSQHIWPSHELQISAYKDAMDRKNKTKKYRMGILRLGYKGNKLGYKFKETPNKIEEFRATQVIWKNETANIKPLQREYPIEISLKK